MTTVDDMIERLASFDLIEEARQVMDATQEQVLNLNRKQVYELGIDSQGSRLEVYAGSQGTAGGRGYYGEKVRKNPRTAGNPSFDLLDTGATLEGLTLDFQGEEYAITPHTSYINEVAPESTWGLTPDSKDVYWEESLQPGLVQSLAEVTGGTIGN